MIMALHNLCEPCLSNEKSTEALHLCENCDERLCEHCSVLHLKFKASKDHQLILLNDDFDAFPNIRKNCDLHEVAIVDSYCTKHDKLCCQACILEMHQTCENVLSLEKASENVKTSVLLRETLTESNEMIQTLKTFLQSTEDNLKRLDDHSEMIKEEINTMNIRLIQKLNDAKQQLNEDLKQTKDDMKLKIEGSKTEILEKLTKAETQRQDISNCEERGTNSELFLALKEHEHALKIVETDINQFISRHQDFDIDFTPVHLSIELLGSISEITKPSILQYNQGHLLQAQIEVISNNTRQKFQQEGELNLKEGENYEISDIAVTADDKLLISNHCEECPKVYVYTECLRYDSELMFSCSPQRLAVIPDTSKAIVTLPDEKSIQLIDTATLTKEDAIRLRCKIDGIAASPVNIFIGGFDEVNVFDIEGTFKQRIPVPGIGGIYFTKVNPDNQSFLCRGQGEVRCIDFDGNTLYEYKCKLSIASGIEVDRQGYVYVGNFFTHDIDRLSPDGQFEDRVLTKSDGLHDISAMAFDRKFDKLFVICEKKRIATFASHDQ